MADQLGNEVSSINYWPAYLDALVNILIALLFTLSVFAIFSSVLRVVVKDAVLEIDVGGLQPPDEFGLQVNKVLGATASAPDIHQKMGSDRLLPSHGQTIVTLASLEAEKTRLKKLIEEQEGIQSDLSAPPAAPVANDVQIRQRIASADVAVNRQINVNRYPGVKPGAGMVRGGFPSEVLFEWRFPLNKSNAGDAEWLGDRKVVSELSPVNYELISLVEAGNPRQRRESYSRLMAVRSELLRQGAALRALNIRIISESRVSEVPISGSSVFLVPVTGR